MLSLLCRRLPFILLILLFFNSCAQQSEEKPPPPTEKDARLVGELPAGPVDSAAPLRVRFVDPAAGPNLVGHALRKPVFTFQPPIAGIARWEDRRTLTFQPNQPLPMRQEYQAALDLAALFPDRKNLEPLRWIFAVVGREVATFTGDFILLDPGQPRRLRYEGEVAFTAETTIEVVQQAAELRLENSPVSLAWEGSGRQFRFISASIERNEQNQQLTFSLEGAPLELSQTYRRQFELPPLQRMQVVDVEQQDGEQPGISVEFSDEVDPRQEIAGLIAVEPAQPLQLKVLGKKVLVQGDFAHGRQYSLLVQPGIRSRWGPATRELRRETIAFADRKPQIRFASDGVFMPSANARKLRFSTLNLSAVTLEVKKVFANNLGYFLQNEKLHSASQRRDEFNDYFVRRVGVDVALETLEIGTRRNAVLVSVEQDARVLKAYWHPVDGTQEEARIEIPITASMAPNAYAAVSVIQPHAQTANDRPLRMYGIVPLMVEDPATRQELLLDLPESLQPETIFEVGLQTADRRPTQFTLAVVDEGLLSLTDFATPDPWLGFFAKIRLGVRTSDLFGQVLGAHRGDIFRTFSIGGGLGLARQLDDEALERVRRFEPVSMFIGPLATDDQGSARAHFHMPNYVGAVRVMAVAAQGRQYGHAEKTVPVKSELMVVPTLPRVLGPEDRIELPATVFAMEDGIGPVELSLRAEGPVHVQEPTAQTVDLPRAGDADVSFQLQVEPAVGAARIELTATADSARAAHRTEIEVRPSAARVYAVEEQPVAPGQTVSFTVPDRGIPGTNQARVSVRRSPSLNLDHRFAELLRYPYGCIEQTVSSAFPQLYLKDLVEIDAGLQKDIDAAIDAAIHRLRRYRLADGSFSYWPGGSRVSAWSNLYAGHFLLAARDLGYHVPAGMLQDWLRFQQSQALTVRDELRVRTYRVYLLTLVGQPSVAAMNLLRENALDSMDDVEQWLLAGAYQLAGVQDVADQLARRAGLSVRDYHETGGTYGSGLRDRAILLNMLVIFRQWTRAEPLATQIAQVLSAPGWLSTQTSGYALLALGNYHRSIQRGEQPELTGTIRLPGGKEIPFRTRERAFQRDIESGFGGQVEVVLAPDASVEQAFASLSWEGVPLRDESPDEARNLSLAVEWLDENGMRLDPARIEQGTRFWVCFRVANTSAARRVEEVTLMQILPAGWEIENARLNNQERPAWMRDWKVGREEYLDIRDDRVIWFFALDNRTTLDFAVEFSAVTVGEFTLPPARVEAMYDRSFRAVRAGGRVVVEKR